MWLTALFPLAVLAVAVCLQKFEARLLDNDPLRRPGHGRRRAARRRMPSRSAG